MRELIQKTIDVLRVKVRNNLKVINSNQKVIKELLNNRSKHENSVEFEKCYDVNKTLLRENNDYINIQLTLINFLEKYKGTAILDEEIPVVDIFSITDKAEIFDLTIKELVEFDENHPLYNDPGFIDQMIAHYESLEQYEKCQELSELKSKLV